jgi:RNAse (barnase) inhibitor barstar
MTVYLLDGKDMTSREKAYRVIEKAMCFPDWFGHNLDALADCLGELPADSAVVFVNTDALTENLGSYADKLLNCFRMLSEECGFQFIEKA